MRGMISWDHPFVFKDTWKQEMNQTLECIDTLVLPLVEPVRCFPPAKDYCTHWLTSDRSF